MKTDDKHPAAPPAPCTRVLVTLKLGRELKPASSKALTKLFETSLYVEGVPDIEVMRTRYWNTMAARAGNKLDRRYAFVGEEEEGCNLSLAPLFTDLREAGFRCRDVWLFARPEVSYDREGNEYTHWEYYLRGVYVIEGQSDEPRHYRVSRERIEDVSGRFEDFFTEVAFYAHGHGHINDARAPGEQSVILIEHGDYRRTRGPHHTVHFLQGELAAIELDEEEMSGCIGYARLARERVDALYARLAPDSERGARVLARGVASTDRPEARQRFRPVGVTEPVRYQAHERPSSPPLEPPRSRGDDRGRDRGAKAPTRRRPVLTHKDLESPAAIAAELEKLGLRDI